MAAMLQQSPVVLRQQQKEDQDLALSNYVQNKMRFDQTQEVWSYPQEWQQQQQQPFGGNNPYYYTYQHYPPPHMYQSSPQQPPSRPHRPRTHSSPTNSNIQPQKSSSTPNSSQHYQQRQRKHRPINNNEARRPKSMLMQQPPSARPIPITPVSSSESGRRSSITSTSSTVSQSVSIRSEMSLGTKLSLSKRLRKVFSVGNLRSSSSTRSLGSLGGASSSNVSIATVDMIPEEASDSSSPVTPSTPQRSLRRRSLASLTNLFQRSASPPVIAASSPPLSLSTRRPSATSVSQQQHSADKKDRPPLRVDTTQPSVSTSSISSASARKVPFKGRSPVIAPDSPNSSLSTRSPVTRPTGPHRLASELPSPTPSASSSTSSHQYQAPRQLVPSLTHDDQPDDLSELAMAAPPVIGLHYGLPMHGSPKLKPAPSSSSSSLIDQVTPLGSRRRLQFCPTVQVHETFAAADYDRRCDTNATCQKLTPMIAMKIKQELNEYKLTDMEVHVDSRQYTHFFL